MAFEYITVRSPYGDRPKTHAQKYISTGTHDAKTLRAKARERAAKGPRKVQKSVPATSLVVLHSLTVAHADGFFLPDYLAFTSKLF